MTDQQKKYLSDILTACELIDLFVEDARTYDDYLNDIKTQSAVERQLGIIGEAVNKFNKLSENNLDKSKQIVGFRNRIIHSYDQIDTTIVWAVIKNHLPPLKEEVQKKLSQ